MSWKPIARKRIALAIVNVKNGVVESLLTSDCSVCKWAKDSKYTGELCWIYIWEHCPAHDSCKEFVEILGEMKYKKSKIKRLRKLLEALKE